ncbi:MAG: GTP-binding protein [Ilumatobacter sp.]
MTYQEPEFLPWDGRRVPLTFVAGYLGAGKTTAINEVLATTRRPIAVIVNDVGEVDVDAALIRRRTADTIELSDGCVCCSSVDGFGAAFDTIRARPEPPDHIIVELSGIAEPKNVLPWGSSAGFILDGVVTVVAVDQLQPDGVPAWMRAHLEAQIAEGDLIVLTRTDEATPIETTAARSTIAALAPGAPVVDAGFGRREPGSLGRFLALGGHRDGSPGEVAGPTLFDLHETHTVPLDRTLTNNGLDALVSTLDDHFADRVVRAKGVVELDDGSQMLVQRAGVRVSITQLTATERVAGPTGIVVITVPEPG